VNHLISRIVVMTLCILCSTAVSAAWYEIEVIVFTQGSDIGKAEEAWPRPGEGFELEPDMYNVFNLPRVNPNQMVSGGLYAVPANQRKLSNIAYSLQQPPKQVLAHFSWRSQGHSKRSAPWLEFYGGESYAGQFETASDIVPIRVLDASESQWSNNSLMNDAEPISPIWGLSGRVKFYAKNYFHLEFDMAYRQPTSFSEEIPINGQIETIRAELPIIESNSPAEANATTTQTYRYLQHYPLNDHRRLKLYEKHYIDHPVLGIVAQVRRVSFPQTIPVSNEE